MDNLDIAMGRIVAVGCGVVILVVWVVTVVWWWFL